MVFRGVTRLLWCCATISSFTDAGLIPSPSLAIPKSAPQGRVENSNQTISPAVISIISELCQVRISCSPSRSGEIVGTSRKYLTTHSPLPFYFPIGSLLSFFIDCVGRNFTGLNSTNTPAGSGDLISAGYSSYNDAAPILRFCVTVMVVLLAVAILLGTLAGVLKYHRRRARNVNQVRVVVESNRDARVMEGGRASAWW